MALACLLRQDDDTGLGADKLASPNAHIPAGTAAAARSGTAAGAGHAAVPALPAAAVPPVPAAAVLPKLEEIIRPRIVRSASPPASSPPASSSSSSSGGGAPLGERWGMHAVRLKLCTCMVGAAHPLLGCVW